jgi:hypothetical protein
MTRSSWKGTFVVSLLWAGLAWGQQAVPPASGPVAPAKLGERILNVREGDKPAHPCRVLKTWKTADGMLAYQVQALDSGELMTLVEGGPVVAADEPAGGPRIKGMVTRILHRRDDIARPTGSSTPSTTVIVETKLVPAPTSTAQAPAATAQAQPAAKPVADKPAATTTPLAKMLAQVGPAPATPEPVRATPATPVPQPSVAAQPAPAAPAAKTSVAAQPAPAVPPAKTAVAVQTPPAAPAPMPAVTASATVGTAAPDAKKPADPAPPTDWRMSWGKPVDHKSQPAPVEAELPQAKSKSVDPLNDPRPYSRLPSELKETGKPIDSSKTTDIKVASASGSPNTAVKAPAPAMDKTAPEAVPVPVQPVGTAVAVPAAEHTSGGILSRLKSVFRPDPPGSSSESAPATAKKAAATMQGGAPLGMASVLAAGDPAQMLIQYMPVPVATLPPLTRMPAPPMAQVPQPPRPPDPFHTSGTPGTPGGKGGVANEDMANAFTSAETLGAQQASQAASGTTALNAFGRSEENSMSPSGGMSYAGMGRGVYPTGAPMAQPMYPYQPVGAMAQPTYPQQPYGPMAQGMPYAGGYLPHANAAMAGGYFGAAMPEAAPAPAAAAKMPAGPDLVPQHLTTLRDAMYPSHREWAAENLAEADVQLHPQVVDALVTSARQDTAASVRAACVRSLAKLNSHSEAVAATLRSLKDDTDARVRREADQALATLGYAPEPASQSVVPTGGVAPSEAK